MKIILSKCDLNDEVDLSNFDQIINKSTNGISFWSKLDFFNTMNYRYPDYSILMNCPNSSMPLFFQFNLLKFLFL